MVPRAFQTCGAIASTQCQVLAEVVGIHAAKMQGVGKASFEREKQKALEPNLMIVERQKNEWLTMVRLVLHWAWGGWLGTSLGKKQGLWLGVE